MNQKTAATIRAASTKDLPLIEQLLASNALPLVGVREAVDEFLVAERDGKLVGVIGLETYDQVGLLRSAAVASDERGSGVGAALVESLITSARAHGLQSLVLLTTTAEAWFPRFGFTAIPRDATPIPVRRSAEFQGACPATATVMTLALGGGTA